MKPLIAVFAALLAALAADAMEAARQNTALQWELSDGPYVGSVHGFANTESGAVFAITTGGLRRSVNDGVTWTSCGTVSGTFVRVLPDKRLLVGPSPTGVLSYLDDSCRVLGSVTLPSDFNSPKSIDAIAISSTGRLLASRWVIGLFLSDDNGQSWHRATLPSTPNANWVRSIVSVGSGRLVASSSANVFRSTDNGETWVPTQSGVVPGDIRLESTGALLGTTGDGLWRSIDEGETWTRVGLDGRLVRTVSPAPPNARRAVGRFAAVHIQDARDNAIFRAASDSSPWVRLQSPIRGRVSAFAFTPGGALVVAAESGFFRSSDEGRSWAFHGVTRAALKTIVAGSQRGVVIGGNPGAWRSVDGGKTWEQTLVYLDEGSRAANLGSEPCVFAFVRGNRLLAGTQNGVTISTDRGTTWQRSGLWRSTSALLELPDGSIIAGALDGIFRSTDGGTKWIEQSEGLSEFEVRGLAVVETDVLLASTLHEVYFSTNNGKRWRSTGMKLPVAHPPVLASGRGKVAVAGTDRGVHVFDRAAETWTLAAETTSPVSSLVWDPYGRLWVGTATGLRTMQKIDAAWTQSPAGLQGEEIIAMTIDSATLIVTTASGTFRAPLAPPR